jgi:Rrf2 family protein
MAVVSRYTVALHILSWIALITEGKDEFVSSERIAASVNTSPVFIRRILGTLSKAKIVNVQHGGTGAGWRLAKRPELISLLDVYEAVVDTPLFELHHSTPSDTCIIGKGIQPALMNIYNETEDAMKQQLAKQSIADLLHQTIEQGGSNLQEVLSVINVRKANK